MRCVLLYALFAVAAACPAGNYCAAGGESLPCAVNTYTDVENSTSCLPCVVDEYIPWDRCESNITLDARYASDGQIRPVNPTLAKVTCGNGTINNYNTDNEVSGTVLIIAPRLAGKITFKIIRIATTSTSEQILTDAYGTTYYYPGGVYLYQCPSFEYCATVEVQWRTGAYAFNFWSLQRTYSLPGPAVGGPVVHVVSRAYVGTTYSISFQASDPIPQCTACPSGTFSSLTGQSVSICHRCAAGQSGQGLSCISCSSGKFAASSGSTGCSPCVTCITGQTYSKTPCTSSTNAVCAGCSSCVNGSTYLTSKCTATADTVCSPCTACAQGLRQVSPCTNTSNAVCNQCPLGQLCQNNTVQPCPAGMFCTNGVATACPANTTSYASASSYLDCYCKPGYYGVVTGPAASSCAMCPQHHVCPATRGRIACNCTTTS